MTADWNDGEVTTSEPVLDVMHRLLDLKNLPIVDINVELYASSEKRNKIQVLPTPESPIMSNLKRWSYVFAMLVCSSTSTDRKHPYLHMADDVMFLERQRAIADVLRWDRVWRRERWKKRVQGNRRRVVSKSLDTPSDSAHNPFAPLTRPLSLQSILGPPS